MMRDQWPALIFLVPFLGTFLLPFLARFKWPSACTAAAFFLWISVLLSAAVLGETALSGPLSYAFSGWPPPMGIEWRADSLSALMALLMTLSAALSLSVSGASSEQEIGSRAAPFFMSVLLAVSGLLGMVLTNDFFNAFVFLEISSIATYALIASGPIRSAPYASFRYLLIGTLGATLYLLGVGYWYAATGTLNMSDFVTRSLSAQDNPILMAGFLLIFLGLAIKMGLTPFHSWMPDAYAHASRTAACVIAPIAAKAPIYLLIRISFWAASPEWLEHWHFWNLLKILGFLGIVTGSLLAFRQENFRRLLAYSSVSQIGLIVLALGIHERNALFGAILHLVFHAFMKTGLFLFAASVESRFGARTVQELSGLVPRMRISFAVMTTSVFSLIGIPPLAGFFSKWYMLSGALLAGDFWAAAAVVGSGLLSALYFFKLLEQIFFRKNPEDPKTKEAPSMLLAGAILTAAVNLAGGFLVPLFHAWAHNGFLKEIFG